MEGDKMVTMSRKPSQSLVGHRIKLIRANNPFTVLEPGAEGTIVEVDNTGTVHVKWDHAPDDDLRLRWDDGDRWSIVPQT